MDGIFECIWWTLWIYVGILSLVCIICVFRYMSSSLEVRQGGSVIYWIMILTYKYGFVVLLCIRSFVTYSWLCNMNVRSWIEMGIYMDKYICENVLGREVSTRVHVWPYEMCATTDVTPGGTSASWQTQSSCSACGPYVRFWWIRRLGQCTGMPLIL